MVLYFLLTYIIIISFQFSSMNFSSHVIVYTVKCYDHMHPIRMCWRIRLVAEKKLLLRDDVVLEDWKTTSNGGYDKTLITDYPSFFDGAKLYIVQLTGGIRVNVSKTETRSYTHVGSISIHDCSLWTLQKLSLVMKALAKFYLSNEVYLYVEGTTGVRQATPKSFSPSDELVSSVDWITA